MEDGRYFGKIKIAISGRGLTDFDQIWHSDAIRPSWATWPLKISKIQDGGGRHLENLQKCHVSAALWPISTKFDAVWPSLAAWPLKISNLKNPRWRRPQSWKIAISQQQLDLSSRNLARWCSLTLLSITFRKSGPSSCTFWLVYAFHVSCSFSKTFAVLNNKIGYLNLAIKQQICM